MCPEKDSTSVVLPKDPLDDTQPWSCSKCQHAVSSEAIESKVKELEEGLLNQECEDAEVKFMDFLLEQRFILHPNHFLMTSCRISWLKQKLFQSETNARNSVVLDISISEQLEIADVAMQLLRLADILAPGLTRLRGKHNRCSMGVFLNWFPDLVF